MGPLYGIEHTEESHTMPVRVLHGAVLILQFIWKKCKRAAVSSCKKPVAWCDHQNSGTSVKFLWVLHLALWAGIRTGVKNGAGPFVGCDIVTEA